MTPRETYRLPNRSDALMRAVQLFRPTISRELAEEIRREPTSKEAFEAELITMFLNKKRENDHDPD